MRKYNPTESEVFIDETGQVTFKYVQEDNGPCWPGYKQVGTKMKNGKEVPNCVPIDEYNEKVNIQKALKKVKGLTKDQMQVLMSIPTPALTSMINQLGMLVNSTDEEVNEKLKGYQSSYQRKSKYDGKEFNAKQEFKTLDKIQKALEVADKHHADLQYPYVVDTVTKIWDHLKEASIGIIEYKSNIKDGKYDGKIDIED